ncbi:hypothetical protein QQF64_031925 [Cirrhinus molitorella]|uniref:Uncharacterized protein n=1 Tax=Cirrhinus molitorella TaxID=172907 RepID=A0ABR3MYB1_9TELE
MSSPRLASLGTSTEVTRKKERDPSQHTLLNVNCPRRDKYMMSTEGTIYPKEASSTLEFAQRAFCGINSQTGSKAEKRHKLNAPACTLLRKLLDFDLMG